MKIECLTGRRWGWREQWYAWDGAVSAPPAGDLKLAGITMGEAAEEAIEERASVTPGTLPPPGEDR